MRNKVVDEIPIQSLPKINKKMLIHSKIVEDIIFLVGIAVAVALLSLPYQCFNGSPVPIFVFRNKPALFHLFLVALNFGFTASIMTMSLRAASPGAAQFCRGVSVVCVVAAAGLLLYSALPPFIGSR